MARPPKPKAVKAETSKTAPAEGAVSAMLQIQKKYGSNAVRKLGDDSAVPKHRAIPTGSLALDKAIGIGGLPRGRIVEIYGPEASGKTTLTLHVIAEAQRLGLQAAFVDAEHALDPKYAAAIGVDVKALTFAQPDYGEQALDIVRMVVESGDHGVVVVDSVAALTPKAELDAELESNQPGMQARMMGKAMRMLAASASRTSTTIVFINQLRQKIGVMFGSPETTPGGNALKFYSSVRLDVRRIAQLKQGERVTGVQTRVKVVKNKMAPPFEEVVYDVIFGKGIDTAGELLDMAVASGVVERTGSWHSYNDKRIGNGRAAAADEIRSNAPLRDAIRKKVLG